MGGVIFFCFLLLPASSFLSSNVLIPHITQLLSQPQASHSVSSYKDLYLFTVIYLSQEFFNLQGVLFLRSKTFPKILMCVEGGWVMGRYIHQVD